MSPYYPPPGAGGAPSGSAGGDLTGTYPNPTIGTWVETAAQQGFLAWSFPINPATAGVASKGQLNLTKIWLPKTITVSNIIAYVSTVGVTLSNCFATLYDSTGAKIAGMDTADQSTPWVSTGLKTMAVTTPGTVTGGPGVFIWAALLPGNGSTTAPQFLRRAGVDSTQINANQTAATLNVAQTGTTLTALPASFTPSALTNGLSGIFWAAVS